MRLISGILLLVLNLAIQGQDYKFKAQVEAVSKTGFYNIALSPQITSNLNSSFTDLRLYNSQQEEIPYLLHNVKADTLVLRIQNKDDAPLAISGIQMFELKKFITAELSPDKRYSIHFSDKQAKKPNYDIEYFKDSIPDKLSIVQTDSISALAVLGRVSEKTNVYIGNYWFWIAIIGVSVLLIYMSIRMVRDIKKQDK